jgi:transcription initiation factor TFIIE subunit beta
VDLLELLQDKRSQGGMDYKDLKDSYSKLGVAVEELAAAGQILVIRHKDGNPRVLFCNDEQYNTPIDEGIAPGKFWGSIGVAKSYLINSLRFNRIQENVD